jgi:hypothetical protein
MLLLLIGTVLEPWSYKHLIGKSPAISCFVSVYMFNFFHAGFVAVNSHHPGFVAIP